MAEKQSVFRFKVSLKGIKPMIWRRIELKSDATFWDLAFAIIDAMGWEGYHLFAFEIRQPGSRFIQYIGNPNYDNDEELPAWEVRLSDFFKEKNDKCDFVYDFGDDWRHTVKLEDIHPAKENTDYPVCLGGKRACPPEDCGGRWGYSNLLESLDNPESEDYQDVLEWLGEDFDPSEFNKDDVVFRKPEKNSGMNTDPSKSPAEKQKGVTKQIAKSDHKKIFLKDALKDSLKDNLIIIAQNHDLQNPNKLKKDELVRRLEQKIQEHFLEELIYLTSEQMLLFCRTSRDTVFDFVHNDSMTEEQKDKLSNLRLSIENLISNPEELLNTNPPEMAYLASKGYIFIEEKEFGEVIQVPEELKDLYMKSVQEKGLTLLNYQNLQHYITALTNLYGVCSYHQLHQVFKKYNGSHLSFKNLKDYTLAFSDRSNAFIAEENYFYFTQLDEDEAALFFEYDLKMPYYFPTKRDIAVYAVDLFCLEARQVFNRLSDILLKKTCISKGFSVVSVDYSEAIAQQDEEILDSYDEMLADILFASRMGKGLYEVLSILDFSDCKFKQVSATDEFYATYLELLEKTRKWPLKGNLYESFLLK